VTLDKILNVLFSFFNEEEILGTTGTHAVLAIVVLVPKMMLQIVFSYHKNEMNNISHSLNIKN
jgi:hypothetical protein